MLSVTCIGFFVVATLTGREQKCNFADTVDLTNHTPFQNGSYLYDGVVIPENETAFYTYTLMFRRKSQPAAKHVRGCICDESKGRFCTKLCCERGEFFNQPSRRCEKLTNNMPNEMEILFMNETVKNVNIFDHFIVQIGKPCENPEEISKKDNPWLLVEDGYLLIESENHTAALDTLNYCLSPQYNNESHNHQLTVMSCPIKNEPSRSMVLNSYAADELKSDIWIRFINYATFVWGTAGIFTVILISAQLSNVVPEAYKPNIGYESCWLDTHTWIAAIYYHIPNGLIMVFNIFAFVKVGIIIVTVDRNAAIYKVNRKDDLQEWVFMILRLYLIMGIPWILDIISYCCRDCESWTFLFDVTDFFNASQGILIFILFICRRDVLNAIKEQFHIRKRQPAKRDNEMFLTVQPQTRKSTNSGTIAISATASLTSVSPLPSMN
ncbi:G-protein coupled receptor Mth2-like [Musca autumnalis]|uniref:G-protein coupled receptor Mth2-like n=1 Tax=Musca autumnalis TaxID=221902 RepID=UPI003CF41476